MRSRKLYLQPLFVFGVVFVLLGTGNWIVGAVQVAHYRSLVEKGSRARIEDEALGSRKSNPKKNTEILGRIYEEREKYDAARIKADFFYVVLTGGLLLLVMGLACASFALVKTIRKEVSAS